MQVVFDKIQIDNCWSSHPSTSKINRATVVACHTHNHSCVASMTAQLSMTQVTEATSKTNCPKNTFLSIWRPLKISPAKAEKPTYRTELYYHANFHASRCEISVPGQKIYLFPYRGLPWGLLSHAIHFPEALVKPMLRPNWHVTLQLLFSRYLQSQFGILLRRPVWDPYLPSCKISCRSVLPVLR